MRFLQERRWLDTLSGRLAVGLLIFQDIWAIVVLALQPSFEAPELAPILLTFGGIVLLVGLAALGARFVLPFLFDAVAKVPDLMVSVALAWCFFVGLIGGNLGTLLELLGIHIPLSVSLEMGALIAGMTIASFPYHHDVAAKVTNLRDFFVTLFFVALGHEHPGARGTHVLALALLLARGDRGCCASWCSSRCSTSRASIATTRSMPRIKLGADLRVLPGDRVPRREGRPRRRATWRQRGHLRLRDHRAAHARCCSTLRARCPLAWAAARAHRLQAARAHDRRDAVTLARPRIVVLGFHRVAFALLQDINRQHPEWLRDVMVVDINVQTHAAHPRARRTCGVRRRGQSRDAAPCACGDGASWLSPRSPTSCWRTSNEAIVQAVRSVAPNAESLCVRLARRRVRALYAAGANYVYMPSVETANGVMSAAAASLIDKLQDFRATRDAACGPLTERKELEQMTP